MAKEKPRIKRGEIYYADLGEYNGSTQGGHRPVVILQNNIGNEKSQTTIVSPITSKHKTPIATHVSFIHNCKIHTILLEQIMTINIKDLQERIGIIDRNTLKTIDNKLKISLGLNGF